MENKAHPTLTCDQAFFSGRAKLGKEKGKKAVWSQVHPKNKT